MKHKWNKIIGEEDEEKKKKGAKEKGLSLKIMESFTVFKCEHCEYFIIIHNDENKEEYLNNLGIGTCEDLLLKDIIEG